MDYSSVGYSRFRLRRKKIRPTAAVSTSATVKASQIPVMPQREDMRKAAGIISTSPRSREIIWAGTAFSTEVNQVQRTMLNPVNRIEVKYNLRPSTANPLELRVVFAVEDCSYGGRQQK